MIRLIILSVALAAALPVYMAQNDTLARVAWHVAEAGR